MSIHQILRFPSASGTLVIGHRAAFGRSRDLLVDLPEDAVRTLLLARSTEWAVIAALRRFWQPWQYDPLRTNVHSSRELIDRIAALTANGTLLAYKANRRIVDRDRFVSSARRAIAIVLPQLFATPVTTGAEIASRHVAISADLERLVQTVRRVADHLDPASRQVYIRELDIPTLTTFLAALAAWMDQNEDAIGLIFDALLTGSGLVFLPSAKAQAASHIYRALEIIDKDSHATKELDVAAWWLASAMNVYGPSDLIHIILRGTRPLPAVITRSAPVPRSPPEIRKPPERFLKR